MLGKSVPEFDGRCDMLCLRLVRCFVFKGFLVGPLIGLYSNHRQMEAVMQVEHHSPPAAPEIHNSVDITELIFLRKDIQCIIWCSFIPVILDIIIRPLPDASRPDAK